MNAAFTQAAHTLALSRSGCGWPQRLIQHAEPMSEEEIALLEEMLPAIGPFIERAEEIWEARERLRAQQALLQPEVA